MKGRVNQLKVLGAAALGVLLSSSASGAIRLDDSLVLHLPLTADLKDHSPSRHPIKIVGAVRIEADGAIFGGRKDWLQAPHIPLNERPFAVAVWVRETTEQRTVGLVEQFDRNRPLHHLTLMLRENRQPYFGFYVNDLISPLGISRDREWFHVVFQFTGRERQIWLNGRLICSAAAPGYHGTAGVTAIGKVPRWDNVPGKDFVGFMRDFRIYQRTLDAAEIAELAGLMKAADATDAPASPPVLSANALRKREAMLQVLPENPLLPFLQITGTRIVINGRPGQVYVLQSSGDLNDWRPLARLTNETGAVNYEFTPQAAAEFFRVKVEGYDP